MNKVLNIVNGDSVIEVMRKSSISGNFLPWQDFLHEGPIPEGLSLEALSKIRAKFISEKGLGKFDEIYQSFRERDSTLKTFKKYDKIFLWFEHDLYDQLQLIQILDWFAKYASTNTNIFVISPENYLRRSTPRELEQFLLYNKELVTHNHYITARKAWSALSSSTPFAWEKLLTDDTSTLPFLKDAVKRLLEEYPNTKNGLSRTAHQALLSISRKKTNPIEIFESYQRTEKRIFMGDVLFWDILKQLIEKNLLNSTESGQCLKLTSFGEEVLQGKSSWMKSKQIDSWIGGVHLTPDNIWCWDIDEEKIILRTIQEFY